ncbi:hypothetical protein ANCCAN_06305, partial [Ancylostoma caninum]
ISDIEPVASTSSGRSAVSEEGASCDADASRRQGMTSSSIPSVHCRRLTFRLPPKFAQRLKRIANKQPNTLGRLGVSKVKVGDGETVSVNDAPPVQPCKLEERRPDQPVERVESRQSVPPQPPHPPPGSAGPVCQPPPGYHTIQHQHQQEVGPAVAPHPMQRPAPINNNSPLLVNLLSSQQPAGMVAGPPGANVPPHHQSYSPAASYMYPGGAPPHQHPHPSAVPQNAPPQVMDPQQHMAMQQQMQMEQRQRMLMQQQQAHAAAVAAAQAQQHQVQGQPPQAPLTPGGFYSPATPVQQAQPQQRPPMGYAPPQNPAMFAGQQQPQQVPPSVQQQRMQSYPAQMKPGAMPGAPPVAPGQFRGPPVEPGGMQMMGHSGYPPGTAYPANQGGMSAMQQRMMYQQQHGQAQAGPPGHAGQPWPAQRGPPVPYPTPMDGMHGGPGSVHPAVSQRTSGSGEYSRDGTSPATPHQFNPGSHQGMMMGHAGTPMSRADSQGSVFGNSSYPQQPPSAQQSVEETEHPVDKLFTGQDDQLADLGDLDDIEPMADLGVGVLDDLTGNPQGDALGNMGAHIGGPQSVDPSSANAQTSNGDRIDSSIASVVEMVSKSGAAPSICGAPAVSQTGTHPTVGGNVAAMKRRPSNAQMAANIVAVAGQQPHLIGDQRYAMGAPHHMMNPGQIPMQMQMMQPMASSPSAGNLSLEHNARAQLFHGRAGMAKTGENGPGRLVNGHDQTGVPNGARRSQPQPQPSDAAEEERIAELVKKARSSRFVVAQGESQKAAAAEQKAKLPRKNRRKTDLSKEASPRDDEEPFIVDGSRRRAPGVASSHVQAAASNFQATMARQQQLMKQQQVQEWITRDRDHQFLKEERSNDGDV